MPAGDPLDEFADEKVLMAPLPPTPRAVLFRQDPVLVRQDVVAPEPRLRTKPEVVVRLQVPMSRLGATLAATGLLMSGLAALVATAFIVTPDRGPVPPPHLIPSPSPIEIEYPDYPGAPPLRNASTSVPSEPARDKVAVSDAAPSSTPVVLAAASPFNVRSAKPQVVLASAGDAGADARLDDSRPADAPPRRIGPPLALTTLGGNLTRNTQLALVLDVTEQGDVSRVVSHEAVDVDPDVIDSVVASARSWRYEPARRDGIPVPARVRVVVQLNSGQ